MSAENVRIAIIDSGVTQNTESDIVGMDFSKEGYFDYMDHGTPIYDIISNKDYGIAPNAIVYSLKVITKYGNASTTDIVKALEWCLENSIDIINMSLSFGTYNESIECLVRQLISSGVIIVSSIANTKKEVDYPSMYNGVICVGKTDNICSYSNANSIIFEENYSIKVMGKEGITKDYVGNSFLAPIVTGIIACLINETTEGRRWNSEELVEEAKQVLLASDVNIQ